MGRVVCAFEQLNHFMFSGGVIGFKPIVVCFESLNDFTELGDGGEGLPLGAEDSGDSFVIYFPPRV